DEQLCVLGHCRAAGLEEPDRVLVVPIRQDAAEEIDVAAFREALEKGPAYSRDPICKPRPLDVPQRTFSDSRLIEYDRPQPRIGLSEGDRQSSVPAADVDDEVNTLEVVRLVDGVVSLRRRAEHRLAEDLSLVG